MEELKAMLEENYPHIDFDTEKSLMSDGVLDSMAVVAIIAEIENMFDISVTMEYIQPDYFESVEGNSFYCKTINGELVFLSVYRFICEEVQSRVLLYLLP